MNTDNSAWLDEVKWDEKGLVPAIAQDAETGLDQEINCGPKVKSLVTCKR